MSVCFCSYLFGRDYSVCAHLDSVCVCVCMCLCEGACVSQAGVK